MVSADSVNLDVLELIFGYLSGNDLTSIALVSRSFFAGVIPRLYSTLLFRLSHVKKYPSVMSPFVAVTAHPEFATFVRHIDIRSVPVVKTQYNSNFLIECKRALDICPNIMSFRCSINALPPFISSLAQKDRLRDLRIYAHLTTEQSIKMARIATIRSLTLDFPSWNILNLLPQWAATLRGGLTSLTLFMANELNETVLGAALAELPGLLGLHVIGCPKIHHPTLLPLLTHTPHLESLSLTTGDGARPLAQPPPSLASLRHLAIDTCLSPTPLHAPSSSTLTSLLTYINSSSPHLSSFILRYPGRSEIVLPHAFIQQLISAHATSLTQLSFLNCVLGTTDSLAAICKACVNLERLDIFVTVRELSEFTFALAKSRTLRTLIDASSTNRHALRPSLNQAGIRMMMVNVPSLRNVVTEGRVWRVRRLFSFGGLGIELERRPNLHAAARHWFVPRE
ncbi:hypothetical protein R3P38DRAFT_2580358 [Favolaschia claudopus]|uniref:F-box domain-containing protein n=1 Tax=Favolaschia claudopus TaxID=2862362 RepID=A0AAV9ZE37_9AGAR